MVNPGCCAASGEGTAPSASAAARIVEGFRRVVMAPKATVSLNPWRCPILAADAQENRRGPDPDRTVPPLQLRRATDHWRVVGRPSDRSEERRVGKQRN